MANLNEANAPNNCDVITSLFPKPVQVAISNDDIPISQLYKEEQALIEHAINKRQMNFAAGRICAKRALSNIGIEEYPILMDDKGAPIWPVGIIGSISHATGYCVAVVARAKLGESLGLDVEEVARIKESIWLYSFCSEEVVWLRSQSTKSQQWASVMFAAKEAFYKAQYPLTHSWLGFKDVVVSIDQYSEEFELSLLGPLKHWPAGRTFKGRFQFFESYIAAGIWIVD